MSKYLLRFNKKGNMRFLSHLDLNRLFRRALKKEEIAVAYSNGFNPHEKINVIQPLSLGYTSDSEYFEITTTKSYEIDELCALINKTMPLGIKFFDGVEVSEKCNFSNLCEFASYSVLIPGSIEEFNKVKVDDFLNQQDIVVLKRDKKTKTMVEKSVKHMIKSISKSELSDQSYIIDLTVRCAVNETLNPVNLLKSLFEFSDVVFSEDEAIVNRNDLLTVKQNTELSLFDLAIDL